MAIISDTAATKDEAEPAPGSGILFCDVNGDRDRNFKGVKHYFFNSLNGPPINRDDCQRMHEFCEECQVGKTKMVLSR